ncbi:PREDICTED: protein BHLHb9-like [Chrysochloris asiatica]|uniref:Protein BHLHb9-like n=1 Tax=Chrysochloris asiatica TaxID=185453 RepID=A0A9B0UCX1_CHRAS|nr:PREDICTED: protein BHLHb9-like [Chrysochloris asiatica]
MSKNKSRAKGKARKGAGVKAKAGKEALGMVRLVAKTQAKAGFETGPVAEKKARSKTKIASEQRKERVRSEPKSTAKAKSKASVASRCTCKDDSGIDAWFWDGEEASIGSWFWNGEEFGDGVSSFEEELSIEPVTETNCKPMPRAEEEEGEDIFGNWFWDGDETSFDPNPRSVSRIVKAKVEDGLDEQNRPKDWSEASIWSNTIAEISAMLALRARPPSYIALPTARKNTLSLTAAEVSFCEGTTICLQSVQEHPFDSETCTQTIEEIRRQLRIRKLNGIKPFPCPCKMECCLDSEEFEKLVGLLKSNSDPVIHKIAQIAMGIIKVHPFAQQFINELGVLTVIESLLNFESPDVTKKAEITLNPISVRERRRMIDIHVVHMCKETVSFPLNSPGQRSGLKELGQISTDSDHHCIVSCYLSELFHILAQGNRKTRNLVLKVLLNMSENPTAAIDMIETEALSVLKLIFNQKEAKANLVSAVAIFINIKEHIRKGSIVVVNPLSYNELKAMFREIKMIIEKL